MFRAKKLGRPVQSPFAGDGGRLWRHQRPGGGDGARTARRRAPRSALAEMGVMKKRRAAIKKRAAAMKRAGKKARRAALTTTWLRAGDAIACARAWRAASADGALPKVRGPGALVGAGAQVAPNKGPAPLKANIAMLRRDWRACGRRLCPPLIQWGNSGFLTHVFSKWAAGPRASKPPGCSGSTRSLADDAAMNAPSAELPGVQPGRPGEARPHTRRPPT